MIDWATIITALIGGGITLVGAILTNNRTQAIMEVKLDTLNEKVEKHNQLVERTYKLERDVALMGEKLGALESCIKVGGTD